MENKKPNLLSFVLVLVLFITLLVGVLVANSVTHFFSKAAQYTTLEAENSATIGAVQVLSDSTASNGQYLQFGGIVITPAPTAVVTPNPTALPTVTPQPTNLPGTVGFQPSAPYYATFFYPWYQNPNTDGTWSQWNDLGHGVPGNWFSEYLPDPEPTKFDPANELYSSSNDSIIYWQLRKLAEAKQEVAISSWWGQTHKTNGAFRHIITDVMNRADNPYPNLRWAIYYEKEGFGNPPLSEIVGDLNYIKSNYATQKGYLKINGKPVVFVYNAAHSGSNPSEDLSRWSQARALTGFYVVMKADPLNAGADPLAMDGWHEYAPAIRTNTKGNWWYFVSPGFWLNNSAERLPRDPASFEAGVKAMVSSNVTWKLTETWNEWGEGSGVEPADQVNQTTSGTATLKTNGYQFKNLYVDILNRNLPALETGSGSSGTTPAPTSKPPATPISSIPPVSGTDPVVAAVGDIVCGAGSTGAACKQQETANVAAAMNPAAVLVLGDTQYESGSYADFMNFYDKSWGRFKSITYPTVGNHEYITSGASGYYDYFNGVGVQSGRAGDRSKGYYAVNIGSWRVYNMNSNCSTAGGCGAGSPQEQWLRADMAANPKMCTIMTVHHPLWTSGSRANEGGDKTPLYKAFYDGHGELVLAGHEHNYERFAPMTASGAVDNANGLVEIVNGAGGRNFTQFVTTAANSVAKNDATYGVLKLVLHASSYDFEFVPIAGSSYTDKGTNIPCH